MERIIRIDGVALEEALRLSPQERLRQANAAFRLYYSLHHPYDNPQIIRPDSPGGSGEIIQEGRLSS